MGGGQSVPPRSDVTLGNVSSRPVQIRFMKNRLESLEHEKENLFSAITNHVDPLMKVAKDWIDNQDTSGKTFEEVRDAVDQASDYFLHGCIVPEESNENNLSGGTPEGVEADDTHVNSSQDSAASSDDRTQASFERRVRSLENHGRMVRQDIARGTSTISQVSQNVEDLNEKIRRLEQEKRSLEDRVKLLEDKVDPTHPKVLA